MRLHDSAIESESLRPERIQWLQRTCAPVDSSNGLSIEKGPQFRNHQVWIIDVQYGLIPLPVQVRTWLKPFARNELR